MVKGPRQWRWSSYRASVSKDAGPARLQTDWILRQFGARRGEAVERYIDFVRAVSDWIERHTRWLFGAAVLAVLLASLQWWDARRAYQVTLAAADDNRQAARDVATRSEKAARPSAATPTPAEEVRRFVFDIASATLSNLAMSGIEIVPLPADERSMATHDIHLSLTGTFAAARSFISTLLQSHPQVALETITVEILPERPGSVHARMVFRHFMARR